MKSLRELYRIGNGPSSSHTMGPAAAALMFKEKYKEADSFKVILYGSLAATGVGHCTDSVIVDTLSPIKTKIVFDEKTETPRHPNTLDLIAYKGKEEIGRQRVYSTGGGAIEIEGEVQVTSGKVVEYRLTSFDKIRKYCNENKMKLYDYVYLVEPDIKEYLKEVWQVMKRSVEAGLVAEGVLPGKLKLKRRAKEIFNKKIKNESKSTKKERRISAYAFAVAEENAGGGVIVTAPTCGACGVLPASLYYSQEKFGFTDKKIVDALATAGLIGNLIKTNASISGAECGCQAEIGSACSMAAAAITELHRQDIEHIECAASIAMEHYLGLTCDPIYGLVQIPCIERNAVSAMRALNASRLAWIMADVRTTSFDLIIETMYQTGKDMHENYRETSKGGLAKFYSEKEACAGK
ncbi:MAG: L-serine ammonia-lyase [Firmicutes bacterium]|nr:L-serine ammonia-lyase [Bacillota bacterium]MCL2771400.1 L-serine ammonia-lyase [Bacillota bacterium]